MANKPLHLENQRFGRLVAKELVGKVGKANLWLCVCDCGNEHRVKANYLKMVTEGV